MLICHFRLRTIVSLLTIISCLFSGCSLELFESNNTEFDTIFSPKNGLKAIVFERESGASSGFNTQISVLSAVGKLPDASGNVFAADTNRSEAPAWNRQENRNGPEVKVRWISENEIEISYDKRARVFVAENKVGDVVITYKTW